MKTNKHFKSLHVIVVVGDKNTKVTLTTSFFSDVGEVGSFFIPSTSAYNMEVIKSRAKHDLNITFDHNTATYRPE